MWKRLIITFFIHFFGGVCSISLILLRCTTAQRPGGNVCVFFIQPFRKSVKVSLPTSILDMNGRGEFRRVMMNIRVAGHGAWLPLLSRVVSIKAEGRRCGVNEQTDIKSLSQKKPPPSSSSFECCSTTRRSSSSHSGERASKVTADEMREYTQVTWRRYRESPSTTSTTGGTAGRNAGIICEATLDDRQHHFLSF